MNKHVVYKICCLVNNKSYIGVTTNFKRRLWGHRTKKSGCLALANAIAKYGWNNFTVEILVEHLDTNEAYSKEVELIEQYNTIIPNGYNITAGGRGGQSGRSYTMSEEHKRKISESHRGKKHTDETKQLLSDQRKNEEYQERQRLLRSTDSHKAKKQSKQPSERYVAEMERRKTAQYKEEARLRRKDNPHTISRIANIKIALTVKILTELENGQYPCITRNERCVKRPWVARVYENKKAKYLGAFSSKEQARDFLIDYFKQRLTTYTAAS